MRKIAWDYLNIGNVFEDAFMQMAEAVVGEWIVANMDDILERIGVNDEGNS